MLMYILNQPVQLFSWSGHLDITIQASCVHRTCKLQPACIWRVSKPCISPSRALEKICTQELFHSSYTPTSCIPTLPGAAHVQRVNGCCGRSYTAMGIPSQVGLQMLEPNCLQNKKRDREMHPQPLFWCNQFANQKNGSQHRRSINLLIN